MSCFNKQRPCQLHSRRYKPTANASNDKKLPVSGKNYAKLQCCGVATTPSSLKNRTYLPSRTARQKWCGDSVSPSGNCARPQGWAARHPNCGVAQPRVGTHFSDGEGTAVSANRYPSNSASIVIVFWMMLPYCPEARPNVVMSVGRSA